MLDRFTVRRIRGVVVAETLVAAPSASIFALDVTSAGITVGDLSISLFPS
jgi:hypothetical protein